MKICGVDNCLYDEEISDEELFEHNVLDNLVTGGGCDEGYSCKFCGKGYSTLSSGSCIYCALCHNVCCPYCTYLANNFEDLNVDNYYKHRTIEKIEECKKKLIDKDCDESTIIECINYLGNHYCCQYCFQSANDGKYISVISIFEEIEKQHPGLIKKIVKDKTIIKCQLGNYNDIRQFLIKTQIKLDDFTTLTFREWIEQFGQRKLNQQQ